MLLPKSLKVGKEVAFVSPSAGLAKTFRYRVIRAKKWFEKEGYKVSFGKHFWKEGYIAGEPEERAEDLNAAMDKDAIIPLVGGDHSIQLLRFIDYKKFKKKRPIFVGFSDITVLHLAFYKMTKVVTFYGPMVLSQFGDVKPHQYTIKYFFKAVRDGFIGKAEVSNYTDAFYDWAIYKNKVRKLTRKNKYIWIKEGYAEGDLLGGCLPSILRVAGTKYFPNFKRKIIFIETPEDDPGEPYTIDKVDADLLQLIEIGVFDKAQGLVVGIPYRYSEKMKREFYELLKRRFESFDFPILANVNFGHTNPIITIPYGVKAILDSNKNSFEIVGRSVKK